MVLITHMKLKAFRSIGQTPLEFELGRRITLFIGPNNMGKSNILRALELILKTPFKPFKNEGIECRNDDFPNSIFEERTAKQTRKETMDGNIQIEYSPTHADRRLLANKLVASLYPGLKNLFDSRDVTQVKQKIEHVINLYLTNPMCAVAMLESKTARQPILKRIFTRFSNLTPETIKKIDVCMDNIGDIISGPHKGEEIQHLLADTIFPKIGQVPQDGIPVDIGYKIPFEQLQGKEPTLESIRDYIFMMKETELSGKTNKKPFTTLVRLLQNAFSDVETIEVGLDPNTNKTRVLLVKRGQTSELGCQGDGFKRVLVFLVYLANSEADVVLIDEPERYLHPYLESNLFDYLLNYTSSQIVMVTHSKEMINAVPPKSIQNEDVIIYGVSMDNQNKTLVNRIDESGLIKTLENLGITVSRYDKHMAALAGTHVLVEGKSDKKYIEKILEKHGKLNELHQCNPFFISLEGVSNLTKISPDIYDLMVKGDDSLKTPRVPLLVIKDRDEERKEAKDHELILTVREIENVVISKSSIRRVAQQYFKKLGFSEKSSNLRELETALIERIGEYLPRWALLHHQTNFTNHLKPLLWKKSIGEPSWEQARACVEDNLQSLETKVSGVKINYGITKLEEIHGYLKIQCFPKKRKIDYGFLCSEVPGKDFIKHILPDAMVLAATRIIENQGTLDASKSKLRSIAGVMSTFESLLDFSDILHPDLERFLAKLKKIFDTTRSSG